MISIQGENMLRLIDPQTPFEPPPVTPEPDAPVTPPAAPNPSPDLPDAPGPDSEPDMPDLPGTEPDLPGSDPTGVDE